MEWEDKMEQGKIGKKKIVLGIFVLIQISALLFCLWGMSREKEIYRTEEQAMRIYGGNQNADGTYYIDENTKLEDSVFLAMELPNLGKGVYEVQIEYDTDAEQVSRASSEKAGYRRLYGNAVSLRPSNMQKEVSYRFMLWDEADDLKVEILYTGIGMFSVKDFRVVHTRQEYSMGMFFVLLFSLLAGALFYFGGWCGKKDFGREERKVLFGLAVIFLLSCSNLMIDYFHLGDDMMFHANRVEGIAREWMNGNFPARLEAYCMYGMGYPVSIMYPEVFLWPAALLRVIGFDLAFCMKGEYIFINLLTTLVSYVSFKNIFEDRQIGLWGSAVYTLSIYRLYNIYSRAAVGEFIAMTFLPLICWGLNRAFSEEEDTVRERKTVFLLAFGYMGVLYSHVLSMEFVVFYTVILCILFWKRFFRKSTFFTFMRAVFWAAGLSLWFLIPFLDYSLGANLNVFETGYPIQKLGLYPTQLFWFFPRKGVSPYMYISGMQHIRPYSMGISLAAVLFCFIYMKVKGINGKRLQEYREYPQIKAAAVMGGLAMFMSLNIFPWDTLIELSEGIRKVVYSIQFPYRFLVIVTVSLSFLGCGLFAVLKKRDGRKGSIFAAFVLVLAVAGSSFYLNDEIQQYGWSDFREAAAMGSAMVGGGEYLPADTEVEELPYTEAVPGEGIILDNYRKENAHAEFECINEKASESFMECNLLYYPGYEAKEKDTGETLEIVSGKNNVLRVKIPAGFRGSVAVDFVGKIYWKIGDMVSAALWLVVICFGMISCYKKGKLSQYGMRRKAGVEE